MWNITMCPITKYTVVTGDTRYSLVQAVNQIIDRGWEPIGGVQAMVVGGGFSEYHQAMILRDCADTGEQEQD